MFGRLFGRKPRTDRSVYATIGVTATESFLAYDDTLPTTDLLQMMMTPLREIGVTTSLEALLVDTTSFHDLAGFVYFWTRPNPENDETEYGMSYFGDNMSGQDAVNLTVWYASTVSDGADIAGLA